MMQGSLAPEMRGGTVSGKSGIIELSDLPSVGRALRSEGQRLVLTNGCFDLLHAGHVQLLESAKSFGNVLLVAVNSDRSVRELKGPTRPVVPQDSRALVLAALVSVDLVVIFDTLRVTPVIEAFRPDVFVKGGDYTVETLDVGERNALESIRAEIVIMSLVDGLSTTGIINKIAGVPGAPGAE